MMFQPRGIRNFLGAVATLACFATSPLTFALAAEDSVVSNLLGTWGGSGRINYTDGSSEAIRCTSYDKGVGRSLSMVIQCKSEKNPIHIRSNLEIDGGRVSGNWEERTFNASGSISGNITSGSMSLSISGGGFNGSMSVSFSKSSQNVNITTQGIAMSRATMNLSRK